MKKNSLGIYFHLPLSLLMLMMVVYAMRTLTLTQQSMWIDEIMALYFTQGSFSETLHTIVKPEHNGPLFYLLLFTWRRLAGESDFAIRYLSLSFSILTLPIFYQWGKALIGRKAALLATWLMAFSPFTLWFAQEAKMYALHMLVVTASSLALLRAFQRGHLWRWLLFAFLTSMVLYSHLFGMFFVAAQGGVALLLGWRRWHSLRAYIATMLGIALAHLPLLHFALLILQHYQPHDQWRRFVPLGEIIRNMLLTYFFRGPLTLFTHSPMIFLLPLGLIVIAIFTLIRRDTHVSRTLLIYAIGPVLLFYVISYHIPVYDAKYLSATAPSIFLLTVLGIRHLAHFWKPMLIVGLTLAMLMMIAIVRDWSDPRYQRGDWRFVAHYVESHEGEHDRVVISAYYTAYAFWHYYRGHADVCGFDADPYHPTPFFEAKTEGYDHLWLILHHDQAMAPGNKLKESATQLFPVMTEQYPNGGRITLIGYQVRWSHPSLPSSAIPLDLCFEDGICLVGYHLDATRMSAKDKLSHPPSHWLHVTLYWQRGKDAYTEQTVRPLVRLVDQAGNVWGENLVRSPDLFERHPPSTWAADRVVESHFDVNLNPVTPAGFYFVEVSLTKNGDPQMRLNLREGHAVDRANIARVEILP